MSANRAELSACFHNIIGNAIKYAPLDSKIHIQCEALPSDFDQMFQPGAVLSARPTGHESSSGYGLYSCKKIIESHHGKISVRNHPAGGAVVNVELPLA